MRTAPRVESESHRADIQALRGVAVLVVVLYHAGLGMPGGYVGVDVFFVVSGFVISTLLLRELDTTGRVRFAEFWARRARRLLPLLGVVLVVGLVGSALLLAPAGTQQQAANTAAAAALFGANGYLYAFGDQYFAADATNPFLHTWSLAVEEQTYLVLPLVLFALWRLGGRWHRARSTVALGMVGLGLASLVLSVLWTAGWDLLPVPKPEWFAFYGPITRWWEFTVGVVLALAAPAITWRNGVRGVVAAGGAASIAVAVLGFDDLTPFPGAWAAVPVVGAAALLAAGSGSSVWQRRLAPAPLVWLGDRSYGWYLWHWPCIVLAAAAWPATTWTAPVGAVVSLGLTQVTWQRVEQRFRHDRAIVGTRALRLAALSLVIPASLGLAVRVAGDQAWWNDDLQVSVDAQQPTRADADACNSTLRTAPCIYRSGHSPTVLLVGDSHAGALADAVGRAVRANGADFAVWTRGSCPVLLGVEVRDGGVCADWVDDVLTWVRSSRPAVVMLHTSRAYAEPGRLAVGGIPADDEASAVAAFVDGEHRFVEAVKAAGSRVVIVEGVPTYPGSRIERANLADPVAVPQRQSLADFLADTAALDSAVAAMARSVDVTTVPTWPELCRGGVCSQRADDGTWWYRDWHHLTLTGAAQLDGVLTAAVRSALR